jgi:Domain of unknown function (DUF4375)
MMITVEEALAIAGKACKNAGFDPRALSPSLQTMNLIGDLDFEVNLGNVYGWLINMGEYGPDTVKALETVGAHQCAAIVREILALFPDSKPAFDCRERVRQMEAIGEVGERIWGELGDRLLSWPDDIYVLLQKFVAEHEVDFT